MRSDGVRSAARRTTLSPGGTARMRLAWHARNIMGRLRSEPGAARLDLPPDRVHVGRRPWLPSVSGSATPEAGAAARDPTTSPRLCGHLEPIPLRLACGHGAKRLARRVAQGPSGSALRAAACSEECRASATLSGSCSRDPGALLPSMAPSRAAGGEILGARPGARGRYRLRLEALGPQVQGRLGTPRLPVPEAGTGGGPSRFSRRPRAPRQGVHAFGIPEILGKGPPHCIRNR
jgi:hypothetical protein